MFRKTRLNTLRALIIAAIALLALATAKPGAAGERMPHFSLPVAKGAGIVDSDTLKGKVLLVNFWATWCPPCRKEMPALMGFHEKYAKDNFSVIGISVDMSGSKVVEELIDRMQITYPIVMGNSAVSRAFGGIMGIPVSFLIDRHGMIVNKYIGYVVPEKIEKDIIAILGR